MKHAIKLGTTLLLILGLSITQFQCQNTQNINPNFSQIEFDKLADEVSNGNVTDITAKLVKMEKESFLILDCREVNEYDISHIKDARRVGFDDFDLSQIEDIPKSAKIVTYCLVGKRSEMIGEKLQNAGYKVLVDMNLSRQIRHVGQWAFGPSIHANEERIIERKKNSEVKKTKIKKVKNVK